jgi:hypothetical protein
MTPFDPTALLVMLLTFYPDVSPAALALARRERPDYFAGGTLGGSHGDKFTTPDGRGWDLIFDVENATGQRRWQVLEVTNQGGGDDAQFPLEPGPLTPIDATQFPPPQAGQVFEPIVAAYLDELAHAGDTLDGARLGILEHSSPAPLQHVFGETIDPADAALSAELAALHLSVPDTELATTTGSSGTIAQNQADYTEPPPADLPPYDPGQPPPPGLPPPEGDPMPPFDTPP